MIVRGIGNIVQRDWNAYIEGNGTDVTLRWETGHSGVDLDPYLNKYRDGVPTYTEEAVKAEVVVVSMARATFHGGGILQEGDIIFGFKTGLDLEGSDSKKNLRIIHGGIIYKPDLDRTKEAEVGLQVVDGVQTGQHLLGRRVEEE